MLDKGEKRENKDAMRSFLTVYMTVQALLLILFFGCSPYFHLRIFPNEAMDIVQLVMPIFTGYLGLILGFYFGSEKRN